MATPRTRIATEEAPPASEPSPREALADLVRYSMTLEPRQLPAHLLYDDLGSALFDAICHLPWYRVTRAELRLLERHAADVGAALSGTPRVIELGCGNGDKLSLLVGCWNRPRVDVHLIDVSPSALAHGRVALERLSGVRVTAHQATYETGLLELSAREDPGGSTLVAFFGSNIGNFTPPDASSLLHVIHGVLRPGDGLLLGADLVKPARDLLVAYDDPLGLTAAFNKNLLVRLNAELGADFDLDLFEHRARWNARESRVEMHLVSRAPHEVTIPPACLTLRFEAGESIWTESSYKFEPAGIVSIAAAAGFACRAQWIDEPDRFALTLLEAE